MAIEGVGWSSAQGKTRRALLSILCNVTGKKYTAGYGESRAFFMSPSVGAEDGKVSAVWKSRMILLGTTSSCDLLCRCDS